MTGLAVIRAELGATVLVMAEQLARLGAWLLGVTYGEAMRRMGSTAEDWARDIGNEVEEYLRSF